MSLNRWVTALVRFLSGREGADRQVTRPKVTPIELPEIEPPHQAASPDGRVREKAYLDKGNADRERELMRLRALAQARRFRRDS